MFNMTPTTPVSERVGEESHWINFLAANNVVRSSAFGFGGLNATNANNLEPIAWQAPEVAGTNTTAAQDGNVIVVNDTNIALLGSVLQSTVPGAASGNVLTAGTDDAFGADGGRGFCRSRSTVKSIRGMVSWARPPGSIRALPASQATIWSPPA